MTSGRPLAEGHKGSKLSCVGSKFGAFVTRQALTPSWLLPTEATAIHSNGIRIVYVAYRSDLRADHTRKAVTPSRPPPAETKAAATAMDSTHL